MTGWGNTCGLPQTPVTQATKMRHHPGQTPDLTFKLMKTERNTTLRKVYEAMLIYEYKPSINDKEECKVLERFLVRSCNYLLR